MHTYVVHASSRAQDVKLVVAVHFSLVLILSICGLLEGRADVDIRISVGGREPEYKRLRGLNARHGELVVLVFVLGDEARARHAFLHKRACGSQRSAMAPCAVATRTNWVRDEAAMRASPCGAWRRRSAFAGVRAHALLHRGDTPSRRRQLRRMHAACRDGANSDA